MRQLRQSTIDLYKKLNSPLHCLPDFLIIGAQRSGTTFLYQLLTAHPMIYPALKKEIHFFDWNFHKGVGWYRVQFPLIFYKYKNFLSGKKFITGESSPYYLFHPRVPERVSSALPPVKIIVLLRNPIDRAYSHYHHERARGFEDLSFEEAISLEFERLNNEFQRLQNTEKCRSYYLEHHSYLTRGV